MDKAEEYVNKLVEECANNYAKIIDDFVRAYFASRWVDYFSKQKKINFKRIEIVIKQEGTAAVVRCRLKKGRLDRIINK